MAKTKITLEIATEIAARFNSAEKREDVYKDYPFNRSSIQHALKRHGLFKLKNKKHPNGLVGQIIQHKEELESGAISGLQLSKEIGCTPVYVTTVAKRNGIVLYYSKHRGKAKSVSDETCQMVLDHLKENGGTVNSSTRALGLGNQRIQQAVRSYARRIGFDTQEYRVAYQDYGLWKILPGVPEKCYVADYRVEAECTGCGTVHRVLLCNLRAGVSRGCLDCRRGSGNIPVICKETQATYKSIRDLSIDLDYPYQKLRLTLQNQGVFEHLGRTYIFN